MSDNRSKNSEGGQSYKHVGRAGTPPVVPNPADDYVRNPPNNLGLDDPSEQSRTNDLIGARDTEPVRDAPSASEMKKVQALADKINSERESKHLS